MKEIQRFRTINVENLVLDTNNPRLPKSLRGGTEAEIISFMLLEASTLELMQAIGENGFFEGEQLLVIPIESNKFRVIEGNRRLTSVKLLNNTALATVKKELARKVREDAKTKLPILALPCLVFDEEKEIRKYLGYRHVTGIKSWGLSEKARYLHELYSSDFSNDTLDIASHEIAKTIGSTKSYVKRVLTAFQIYLYIEDEDFFEISNLDDTNFYVGYYSDGINHPNIAKFLGTDLQSDEPLKGLNKANVKSITKWFYEKFELNGRIQTRLKGTSGDLNKLNIILGHPTAYKAFVEENYTLEKAITLAENIEQIFHNSIRSAILNLESADRLTQSLKQFYKGVEDDLVQIRKLTTKIKSVKDDFESKEFDKDDF